MKRGSVFIRALANRFHNGPSDSLLDPLPSEEAQEILESPIESQKPEALLTEPENRLARFHYSWIAAKLKELKPDLVPYVLGALPKREREKLSRLTGSAIRPSPSAPAQRFFLTLLLPHLEMEAHLPPELLPSAPLNALLEMPKSRLVRMIDLLGLYELGETVKNIVDKKQLLRINDCLTEEKQKFLRFCMGQTERVRVSEFNLSQWDGSRERLERMLHKSGLSRLGKALSGNHPDLIWHLARRLDTGRGAILQRSVKEQPLEGITPVVAEQVVQVIKLLTPKRSREP